MNRIFHYRLDGKHNECANQDPWGQCLINSHTDFNQFRTRHLVSIGGQPVVSQHEATYITGRDTCHAHHFAKMIAGAILSGSYRQAPSLATYPTVPITVDIPRKPWNPDNSNRQLTTTATPNTVLWIDTVRGPHACTRFYQEMKETFRLNDEQFQVMCLDMLGVFREDFYDVINRIETLIRDIRPALIVIDDIDHFLPYCGIGVASRFEHLFRDTLNHTESAFLMIGYNHLGKRASTTGNLGKLLFPGSDTIFSVTTQNGVSRVRLVRTLNWLQSIPDAEFIFALGDDNLPRELVKTKPSGAVSPSLVEQTTLKDIITEVVEPGQAISPDELVTRISQRKAQLNRIDRARTIVAQATAFGLIRKTDDGTNGYTLADNDLDNSVNNDLTLPPHPSTAPSPASREVSQNGGDGQNPPVTEPDGDPDPRPCS